MNLKRINMFLVSLCAALFFSASAHAYEAETPRVSVSGSAVTEVDPDTTQWRVSLRTEGKDAAKLSKEHAKRLDNLLLYLKQQNIKKSKIKTQYMNLSENWDYRNGKRVKKGYVASSSLSFPSDIKSYTQLWTGLSAQPGLSVNGSYFILEDPIPVQQQTRIKALKAAQQKAKVMAEALGARLGKPILIEDLSYTDDVRSSQPMAMKMQRSFSADAEMASPEIVSPGKLDIRMRVKVAFELK